MNVSKHVREFQEIAQDQSDAQVELYDKLDATDLIKLIAGTHLPINLEQEFEGLGWREFCGNQHNEAWRWKTDWIERLKATQTLSPFYVFLKRLTHQ